jgi:hypothetical protein
LIIALFYGLFANDDLLELHRCRAACGFLARERNFRQRQWRAGLASRTLHFVLVLGNSILIVFQASGSLPLRCKEKDQMLKQSQKKSAQTPAAKAAPKKSETVQPVEAMKSAPPVATLKPALAPAAVPPKPVVTPAPTAKPANPSVEAAVAVPKPPEKPAPVAPVPPPPAPKTVKTVFTLKAPAAKQVLVCGEFNKWQPEAAPMSRRADGTWETALTLRPGRYQYKFVVDGNWIHDPNAKLNVPNEHYSLNSVIEVRA